MSSRDLFVHCKCGGHWELIFDRETREYKLQCANCGAAFPSRLIIFGPDLSKLGCSRCKDQKEKFIADPTTNSQNPVSEPGAC